MADKKLGIDHAEFGAFMSAVSVPNLFIPFFGGLFLDIRKSRCVCIWAKSCSYVLPKSRICAH